MRRLLFAFVCTLIGFTTVPYSGLCQDQPGRSLEAQVADEHEWMLQSEEIRSRIIGVDENGVPKLCGTRPEDLRPSIRRPMEVNTGSASEDEKWMGWELVPGVVPADGSESFYVKVETNLDNIEQVFLKLDNKHSSAIVAPEGESRDQVLLRDDGKGNDDAAEDNVYTSKDLQVDTTGASLISAYWNSRREFRPESLLKEEFRVFAEKADGTKDESVIEPSLLIMETRTHDPGPINSLDSIQVSNNIVNIKGGFGIQKYMRYLGSAVETYVRRAYDHVKDEYDFVTFMSSNHVEILPNPEDKSTNYNAGLYTGAQVDGEHQTVTLLDALGRGLEANNTTHEILHEWAAPPIPDSLGLTRGAHYEPESSVKSLLGGVKWTKNEDDTFTVNCDLGRGGAYTASPLDLYLMGLIEGSEVDTLWAVEEDSYLGGELLHQSGSRPSPTKRSERHCFHRKPP